MGDGMKKDIFSASEIAELVKNERKAQRVTQVQLSQLANVGVRFVRDIEDGKLSIHFDKLLRVLLTLGISITLSTPDEG